MILFYNLCNTKSMMGKLPEIPVPLRLES